LNRFKTQVDSDSPKQKEARRGRLLRAPGTPRRHANFTRTKHSRPDPGRRCTSRSAQGKPHSGGPVQNEGERSAPARGDVPQPAEPHQGRPQPGVARSRNPTHKQPSRPQQYHAHRSAPPTTHRTAKPLSAPVFEPANAERPAGVATARRKDRRAPRDVKEYFEKRRTKSKVSNAALCRTMFVVLVGASSGCPLKLALSARVKTGLHAPPSSHGRACPANSAGQRPVTRISCKAFESRVTRRTMNVSR